MEGTPPPTPPTPPPPGSKVRHWRKELVRIPWAIKGGNVPFEWLDGNRGVIAIDPAGPQVMANLSNQDVIRALDEAAAGKRGGIVRITIEEYENLKKKFPHNPAKDAQKEMLRVQPMGPAAQPKSPPVPQPRNVAAAAAGNIPNLPGIPISLLGANPNNPPAQGFRPATGRASAIQAKLSPNPQ